MVLMYTVDSQTRVGDLSRAAAAFALGRKSFQRLLGSRSVCLCHQRDFLLESNFLMRSKLHSSSCNLD